MDARWEWAIRWTVLHGIVYALFFYPPTVNAPTWIDWSLPIQLVSGGNLGFYNAGWSAYFGVGAAWAMVGAGALLSLIFPLLQDDDLELAYLVLMLLLAVICLPCLPSIGKLNNLPSISLLLLLIFTEVFYGPVLNLRHALPNVKAIWTEVIRGNAVPALITVALAWGVYAIPPWHAGTYQGLDLVQQTTAGMAGLLRQVAAESKLPEKKELRTWANALLQQTNMAGLAVPIALYGGLGAYECSPWYPIQSLRRDAFETLGTTLDQAVFHIAIVLWSLSVLPDSNADLPDSWVKEYLEHMADILSCTANLLACPRKSTTEDWRAVWSRRKRWYGYDNEDEEKTTATALADLKTAMQQVPTLADDFIHQAYHEESSPGITGILLPAALTGLWHDEPRTIQTLAQQAIDLQTSWRDGMAFPRLLFRLSFLEQVFILGQLWFQGWKRLLLQQGKMTSIVPFWQRRTVRRGFQYLVGTAGLYAMATWWDSYRTLLGSSSTGQWTMVAFYVCFRATSEETMHTGVQRAVGHGLGALVSWGINEAASTRELRMILHLIITAIVTWLIPPPFVYPSKISLPTDAWAANMLEGFLTTYHLTSVLVFSTDIASATQARALSQCLGAAAAVVVASLILPVHASTRAQDVLKLFHTSVSTSLEKDNDFEEVLSEILESRRALGSSEEAAAWLPAFLDYLGQKRPPSSSVDLSTKLTQAAFGAFAMKAFLRHVHDLSNTGIGDDILELVRKRSFDEALQILETKLNECGNDTQPTALMYFDILMLWESIDKSALPK